MRNREEALLLLQNDRTNPLSLRITTFLSIQESGTFEEKRLDGNDRE